MATTQGKWVIVSICLPQVFPEVTTGLVCRMIHTRIRPGHRTSCSFIYLFWFVVSFERLQMLRSFLDRTNLRAGPAGLPAQRAQDHISPRRRIWTESHSPCGWWGQAANTDKNKAHRTQKVSDTICWPFSIGDSVTKFGTSEEFIGVTQLFFYKAVAASKHYSTTTKCARSK